MAWDQKVPFIANRPQHSVYSWASHRGAVEWRDNEVFHDVLTFNYFKWKGSGCAYFFSAKYNTVIKIFPVEMERLIKHGHLINGIVVGHFVFEKKGDTYGLIRVR